MFHHVKELQFNARVSGPDPRFAGLLLEQFGGGNGELKNAAERSQLSKLLQGSSKNEEVIHEAMVNPHFLVLSGGGPTVTDSHGNPWQGSFVNANGDLTVDLRSNIGAESRAKIVYEYLLQFTDDPYVQDTLRFLMTREIAHFQMFSAALETIQPNVPPGVLQGDPRYTHTYFNLSNGASAEGPWNQGQGPWKPGEAWVNIERPHRHVIETDGLTTQEIVGSSMDDDSVRVIEQDLGKERSAEVERASPKSGGNQWSSYPQETLQSPRTVR